MKTKFFTLTIFTLLLVLACQTDYTDAEVELDSSNVDYAAKSNFKKLNLENFSLDLEKHKSSNAKQSSSSIELFMNAVNSEFANQKAPIHLGVIEYYSSDGAGNTVWFENRGNKRLQADFVPGDPRRWPNGDNISYASDGTEAATSSGLSNSETDNAIRDAMNTWDNVDCSKGLNIVDLGSTGYDIGVVQYIVSGGAEGFDLATDVMHSGFTTGLFEAIFGPGSNVLGVTFTFMYCDPCTNDPATTIFTDIDNNGKPDTAFRDIYYNDAFSWAVDGNHIDVETVALHEAGHALSQGHFGKLFQSGGNDKFHFAPRAVMNAGYTGIQTSIGKTDKAGHCSSWGDWPNN